MPAYNKNINSWNYKATCPQLLLHNANWLFVNYFYSFNINVGDWGYGLVSWVMTHLARHFWHLLSHQTFSFLFLWRWVQQQRQCSHHRSFFLILWLFRSFNSSIYTLNKMCFCWSISESRTSISELLKFFFLVFGAIFMNGVSLQLAGPLTLYDILRTSIMLIYYCWESTFI